MGESKEWLNWGWLAGGVAGGSRRPRRLTERRFVQWPHLTVTVLNKLLHGTPTCGDHQTLEVRYVPMNQKAKKTKSKRCR